MAIQLRTGVMVIGSLDWESRDYGSACECEQKKHRVAWRRSRLNDNEADMYSVNVPIRYGRISCTRGNTYTMVISPEYNSRLGVAKVIRCRRDVTTIGDLTVEAEALWNAEDGGECNGRVSASWGCVAVMTPPSFLDDDELDERKTLLKDWAERVSREDKPDYGKFRFSEKDAEAAGVQRVIDEGRLQIPWPRLANGEPLPLANGEPLPLDLLLVTSTGPQKHKGESNVSYPTVEDIASAWNSNDHLYYFHCNQLAGIQTADDPEIEKLLD